ncbi:hypothetical protein JG688_00012117 [Phytophthora aleatoria]|uniref:Uncharacterized protein n=1 Tax=Phytophthora aleatoria TaxID=2496075 RepID=A0A8J5IBT3_9STRA|nr:hypothetical protein JG688_00012117 [Phytophthora aleatoria]
MEAVDGASTDSNRYTAYTETQRLYELCIQPAAEISQLRQLTDEEKKAVLMILNHELEVPYPPRF